jgi:hypothetical protein
MLAGNKPRRLALAVSLALVIVANGKSAVGNGLLLGSLAFGFDYSTG